VFTRAHHWSLFRATRIHSTCRFVKINSNTTLPSMSKSSQLSLSCKFPGHNFVCTSCLPYSCYMPCLSRTPWFDHPNNIWQECKLGDFPVCNFLQPPVTSSRQGQIFPSAPSHNVLPFPNRPCTPFPDTEAYQCTLAWFPFWATTASGLFQKTCAPPPNKYDAQACSLNDLHFYDKFIQKCSRKT
jgi:hypothetical protein